MAGVAKLATGLRVNMKSNRQARHILDWIQISTSVKVVTVKATQRNLVNGKPAKARRADSQKVIVQS